jgi:hypothetical protein
LEFDVSDHTAEEWRPVVGAPNYEVSNLGRVRSLPGGHRKGGVLKASKHMFQVHRVVLKAFVGPPPFEGAVCRHLNGIADDNRVENLTWGTHSENLLDSVRHGTHWKAAKTHCHKGHEFTPENTIFRPGKGRECRACRRKYLREYMRTWNGKNRVPRINDNYEQLGQP